MIDRLRRLLSRSETRAVASSGFTAEVLAARESYISGRRGVGELTASAQGCIAHWENGLAQADVTGTDLLPPRVLALIARSLALRGEFVGLVRDRILPAVDWDVSTTDGVPRAYRLSMPDAGGGRSVTALAPEVLHVRVGSDATAPWAGVPPLRRASLTAGLLHAVESALCEFYETAPIGSQVVPFPEADETSRDKLARSFKGRRGNVLLRESVNVSAAGGPAPGGDWKAADLTPNLQQSMSIESMDRAREAICYVFGVLPGLLDSKATGTTVREAQRHLAQWTLAPIAVQLADEATEKLGASVTLDVSTPLQAFDAGGRARALKGAVDAMAAAKEAGLSDEAIAAAGRFAGVPTGA
jgi:phage portal protein BeeE